jgi:hypothetical protein
MKHRQAKAIDKTLMWFTRAIFAYLVIWGFISYLRTEWMMWR